jgi:hypothetical protein
MLKRTGLAWSAGGGRESGVPASVSTRHLKAICQRNSPRGNAPTSQNHSAHSPSVVLEVEELWGTMIGGCALTATAERSRFDDEKIKEADGSRLVVLS